MAGRKPLPTQLKLVKGTARPHRMNPAEPQPTVAVLPPPDLVQVAVVWGMKEFLDGYPVSRRPSGGGKGFPSGHTSSAFFGAADLAGKCFKDQPAAGAVAFGAAGLTGWSRIEAGEHTGTQVFSGALIGLSFGAASFGIGTDDVSFSVGMHF